MFVLITSKIEPATKVFTVKAILLKELVKKSLDKTKIVVKFG